MFISEQTFKLSFGASVPLQLGLLVKCINFRGTVGGNSFNRLYFNKFTLEPRTMVPALFVQSETTYVDNIL
jgi:hypothetical protein